MEHILVSMSNRNGAWEAWSHALCLSERIDARIYVLLVVCPLSPSSDGPYERKETPSVQQRIELLIEQAKSKGTRVEYFITEGEYEEEVIRFVDHNKITLLVAESARNGSRYRERGLSAIHRLLHRINCRVELVSSRKGQKTNNDSERKDNEHGYSTTFISADRRE